MKIRVKFKKLHEPKDMSKIVYAILEHIPAACIEEGDTITFIAPCGNKYKYVLQNEGTGGVDIIKPEDM